MTLKGQGQDLKHLRFNIWTTVQTAAVGQNVFLSLLNY